jgi:hypothetical protein
MFNPSSTELARKGIEMMWQAAGLVDFATPAAMTDRAEMSASMRQSTLMRGRSKKWRFPGVSWRNG